MASFSEGTLASPPMTDGNVVGRSRLLALMFTDLVGSSEIKDTLTTTVYLPLLRRHDSLLRDAVSAAGGRIQQDTGDGVFAVFATSTDATTAALRFQWLLKSEPWPGGHRLFSRVGIHLGEVAETEVRQDGGNKLVGPAIDLAARVTSVAQSGQILMTRGAFNDARQFIAAHPANPDLNLKWVAHGPYLFKGTADPIDVFEIGIEGESQLLPPPDNDKGRRAIRAGDEQTLGWRPAIGLSLPGAPVWKLEQKIGEGGFGEVWLARHSKSKAIRVFKFCFDADRLRALKREVALFRLIKEALGDRRDISRVIDWRFDDAPYFIEMDYAPLGNLADWAEKLGGIDKIDLSKRLKIVSRTARALAAAHSVGILHKDVKPSNILIVEDADGAYYPRLTDFGIGILTEKGRLQDFNITAAGFTASNLTMNDSSRTGTRMYAPPESMSDKPHTIQGDIYALGVLLYQVVVGDLSRPLGVGWERNVSDELLREDIASCVDVDPTMRLSSGVALAERLETLDARRAERQRAALQAKVELLAKRRRTLVRILGGALIFSAAIMVVIGYLWRDASRQRSEAIKQRNEADIQRAAAGSERQEAIRQKDLSDANATRAAASERRAEIELADSLIAQGDALAVATAWVDAKARYGQATEIYQRLGTSPQRADLAMLAVYLHAPPPLCVMTQPTGIAEKDPLVTAYYVSQGRDASQSRGHHESIETIAYSPDGRLALTGVRHCPMTLWDVQMGRIVRMFDSHQGGDRAIAMTPDGKWALSGGSLGTLTLWNVNSGKAEKTMALAHLGKIIIVAISPDGSRGLSYGGPRGGALGQSLLKLWDLSAGKALQSIASKNSVDFLAFSSDGRRAISANQGGTTLWDLETGKEVPRPGLDWPGTNSIWHQGASVFSTTGQMLCARELIDAPGMFRLFDDMSGKPVTQFPVPINAPGTFTADGRLAIIDSRVLDLSANRERRALTGHTEVNVKGAITPDGRLGLTGSWDTTLRTWLLSATPQIIRLEGGRDLRRSTFSPDGRMVLGTGNVRAFQLWDAVTGRILLYHDLPTAAEMASWSPDGSKIALACGDGLMRVWDLKQGRELPSFGETGHRLFAVAFSPDGKWLAFGGDDGRVRVLDVATSLEKHSLTGLAVMASRLAFSSDSALLLAGDGSADEILRDTHLKLWNVQTGALVRSFQSRGSINNVVFSHDGASVLVGTFHEGIVKMDTKTGARLGEPWRSGNSFGTAGIAFSQDGSLIAAGREGGECIFATAEAHPLRTLKLPEFSATDHIGGVEFSRDQRFILFGSRLIDISWPARYRDLKPNVEAAFHKVQDDPNDAQSLKVVGEWYVFNGVWDWAAELLEKARAAGASVSPVTLAQCDWQINRYDDARREYAAALAAAKDPKDQLYLQLCVSAVERSAASVP